MEAHLSVTPQADYTWAFAGCVLKRGFVKKIRSAVESIAKKMGYTIIPNWRLLTYGQKEYLKKLFNFCNIETVIDVGANEGQYYDFLRREVGFSGQIISVEPIPYLANKLRARAAADPLWQIEECALGSSAGTSTFNIMTDSQFSSLLVPNHSEVGLFAKKNLIAHSIQVMVRTLDELVESISCTQDERRIYLKLDTQGFDLEVIKGGTTALRKVAALQTEAAFRSIYKGSPGYIEVMQFLREHEFEMSAVHPNNEGHFPVLIELDFHLISRHIIPATHRGIFPPESVSP